VLVAAQSQTTGGAGGPARAPVTRSTGPATAPRAALALLAAHDLCLYALTSPPPRGRRCGLQPGRDPAAVRPGNAYQARILPALAAQLAAETTRCGHNLRPRSTP
jgi:hypothetical protein